MSGAVKQKHHYWPNLKYLFLGRSQFNCLLDKCNPAKEPGEQWATGEAIPDHSSQVRNLVLTGWVTLDKTLDLFILQFSFLQNGNKTCLTYFTVLKLEKKCESSLKICQFSRLRRTLMHSHQWVSSTTQEPWVMPTSSLLSRHSIV